MKIAMILDKSFPNDARVENEAGALIHAGHEVFLFCLNYNQLDKAFRYNGIHVHPVPFSRLVFNKFSPLAFSFPVYHYFLQSKISNFLEQVNPDIIHVHDMVAAENIFKIVKNTNIPIVLDLHEDRPAIMADYSHVSSGLGKVLINLKKWELKQTEFISRAKRVVVVTEEAKQNIINTSATEPQNIYVVPNSVNLNEFLKIPIQSFIVNKYKGHFVVLYIGDTGIRRGTDSLIEAASILIKRISNLKIIIVGKSRDDNDLKRMVVNHNLEGIVEFEGWQDFEKLPSYIQASAVCVSPLRRNKHHDSTFANKIFQYMALGKPLVVSDSTAQANLVKNNAAGLIHEASSSQDLAEKILSLYNNPVLLKELGANGRSVMNKKYQWNKVNKQLITLYENIGN